MRYLPFVSLLLLLTGCSTQKYKGKKQVEITRNYTAHSFKPVFEKALYRCNVDGKIALKKFRLSGILYLKNFEDGASRVVFQSEMGSTFFDFGWQGNDSFHVYNIIDQMNKAALIKTLRKDFEMLLARGISDQPQGIYQFNKNNSLYYSRFDLAKGFVYYVTNKEQELVAIENADDKEKIVLVDIKTVVPIGQLSPQMNIKHYKAGFTITLNKMNPTDDVTEQ